jgi:hypothetical protein
MIHLRRGIAVFTLAFVVGQVLLLATAFPAEACAGRCYGRVRWPNPDAPSNHGAYGVLNVDCLKVNNTDYFVDDEIWVASSGASYWVEEGMAYGAPRTDRYWFWADNRPGSQYYEHDRPDLAVSLNTDYSVTLQYDGSDGNWGVYRNGTQIATSTSNFSPPSTWLAAGSESTADTQHIDARVKSLLWKQTNDAWNADWNGSNPPSLQAQDGYTTNWATQWQSIHVSANTGAC